MQAIKIEHFSQRGLNLLAWIFGGGDVHVLLSSRAKDPATVVLESRTIVLDPERTGLYDLALCSRLLKHRDLFRDNSSAKPRSDRWLTRLAQRKLIPMAQNELSRDYPGIYHLSGRFRPNSDLDGLKVVARCVEWNPPNFSFKQLPARGEAPFIRPVLRQPSGPWTYPGIELVAAPELEITGADDDFAEFLDIVRTGQIPLLTIPCLDDLPFLRVPFRIATADSCPMLERIEDQISHPDNKEIIQGLINCFRRKSEVRQERSNLGRHTVHGVRLDTDRLIEAVIASRTHSRPRLFRRRGTTIEPIFDPHEHLAVIAFDTTDLQRQADWRQGDGREKTQMFLVCLVTAYQLLEVDCVVIAFADRLITLPDGRVFCLHLWMTVKSIDEDVDGAFWNRINHLLSGRLKLPGDPTCFHPLSLQDIIWCFDRIGRTQDHSYRAICWWARRGMHRDYPQFRTTDFLMRIADNIDAQMLDAQRRFTGTLDTAASFLPLELREHGRPGQFLSQLEY